MPLAIFAAAVVAGGIVAVLGSEPIWAAAVVAVAVFPLAASVADRRSRSVRRQQTPLLPAALAGLAGGFLVVLLLRLALAAPGWLSELSADCGGSSEGSQQLVLWGSALVFLVAAVPVAITLLELLRRLREGRSEDGSPVPLGLYPLAVAAAGVALIAAGFVTNC